MNIQVDTRRPPHDPHFDDLPTCKHCGEPFEEHMQDGEPLYMCPPECQMGSCYGYFTGGDPRNFFPDGEDMNSPEELANHKRACEEAQRIDKSSDLPCPSGWVRGPGFVAHVLVAPFGIGVQNYPPTCYEASR